MKTSRSIKNFKTWKYGLGLYIWRLTLEKREADNRSSLNPKNPNSGINPSVSFCDNSKTINFSN